MNDRELRALFPLQIGRGALVRADGVAVGLVRGGAPAWDLLALEMKAQLGMEYHRLLLALDAPIDIYIVDQPPDLDQEIALLHERERRTSHPLHADILDGIAGYLSDLAQRSGSRTKQVVWAIAGGHGQTAAHSKSSLDLTAVLQRSRLAGQALKPSPIHHTALIQAGERARRLADSLSLLGGTPPARLMEAEEIAHLVYQCADPVRAVRYPLAGTLLDRVRRIVMADERNIR